jgi:prophage maintenance system killer protein
MDINHIIDLNRTSIEQFGGMFVGSDNLRGDGYGKLDYALQYAAYITDDPYLQAAFIVEKIACGHPFNDGNKRTAFFVCAVYLAMRGIELEINPHTIRAAMMNLIEHIWDYRDFAAYLLKE